MTKQRFFPFGNYVFYYAVNISLFYIHARVLDYTFGRRPPAYWVGAMLFLLNFSLFLLIKGIADLFLNAGDASFDERLQQAFRYLPANIIRNCYFIIFATFYWVGGNIAAYRRQAAEAERAELQTRTENAELQTRLAESRNAYLQQQVNPHMLFNALSFIHSHVYKSSPDAAQCVWLLSDIMRFSLDAAGPDGKTVLEKEAEQLSHLLDINRYRFGGELFVDMKMQGNLGDYRIIPLILLTLTENIFKHGVLNDAQQPASIRLAVDSNGLLQFHTSNQKKASASAERTQALGLQNSRLRLDFAYPGKYTLDIHDDGNLFVLGLTIMLT